MRDLRLCQLKSHAPNERERGLMTVLVAVDARGGDHNPTAIVRNAVQAWDDQAFDDDDPVDLHTVGDEGLIHNELRSINFASRKTASKPCLNICMIAP